VTLSRRLRLRFERHGEEDEGDYQEGEWHIQVSAGPAPPASTPRTP
jgi:hypothetical protein